MQTASTSPAPAARRSRSSRRSTLPWPAISAAGLMLYTFGVAGAMLSNFISSERSWIFMALPCLAPMIWCGAGFFQSLGRTRNSGEADVGLLISAVGWALLAVGLAAKYFAIIAAQPDAYASQAMSPVTPLSIGLGIVCLLLGAGASWFSWQREAE